MQDWTSDDEWKSDSQVFLFRVDTKATFIPEYQSDAIFCSSDRGPCFGSNTLSLYSDPMNESGHGYCYIEKDGENNRNYKIKADENGNNLLTGEGADNEGLLKRFTCVDLEVYQIWM